MKLNSAGTVGWHKKYDAHKSDMAYSIQQTSDGGYVVAGATEVGYKINDPNPASGDVWVLKLDPEGNVGILCDMIETTNVTSEETYISGTDTSVTPADTQADVSDSALIASDSSLTETFPCVGYDDDIPPTVEIDSIVCEPYQTELPNIIGSAVDEYSGLLQVTLRITQLDKEWGHQLFRPG